MLFAIYRLEFVAGYSHVVVQSSQQLPHWSRELVSAQQKSYEIKIATMITSEGLTWHYRDLPSPAISGRLGHLLGDASKSLIAEGGCHFGLWVTRLDTNYNLGKFKS